MIPLSLGGRPSLLAVLPARPLVAGRIYRATERVASELNRELSAFGDHHWGERAEPRPAAPRPMTRLQRIRRAILLLFWKILNPPSRALAGIAPWWVVIETRGRVSGKQRQTPLARGPEEGEAVWLIAVHGRHSAWVRNIEAEPRVRLRLRGRWRDGRAEVVPWDPEVARRFNLYARTGPATLGIDPALVRVDLSARAHAAAESRAD